MLAVHPRARGEHGPPAGCWRTPRGSSPRPRGTLVGERDLVEPVRFIPAPAGNTIAAIRSAPVSPVHPRARGEHSRGLPVYVQAHGSSPRPRGTPAQHGRRLQKARFIPAPAGNTNQNSRVWEANEVHPRARGEHVARWSTSPPGFGSSPRPRGTPRDRGLEARRCRFIPAPAGNTRSSRGSRTRWPVHPRARGEHRVRWYSAQALVGSSPRPRGTPKREVVGGGAARFIPAPAGNTPTGTSRRSPVRVHPRARGEHTVTVRSP